jgi:proline iminopeptidase
MGGNILEKHLTMYYYDQRGSGRSASPSDNNYSLERMAEDIDNIRTISGSDKIYLIAHSFGGVLAYEYAKRYQQHVRGLILTNATLNLPNSLANQIEFVNQLIDTHVTITNPDSIMQPFFAAKKLLRDQGLEYKMLSDNKATVEKLDSIDNSIARNHSFAGKAIATPTYFADFTSGTADIKIPVLVITGTDDHNIGPNHYKLFRFPNQKVTIINGGHVLYYEKNKAFEKAVIDFVRSIK